MDADQQSDLHAELRALRAEVALLRDERDVRRVMVNYTLGIDRRDWDLVRSCFAPDAKVEGTKFQGERDAYLAVLLPGVASFGATMHTIGQQVVELDGTRAQTETYLTARHYADKEGTAEVLTIGVRYLDDLAKYAEGQWIIQRRRVYQVWGRTGSPTSPSTAARSNDR